MRSTLVTSDDHPAFQRACRERWEAEELQNANIPPRLGVGDAIRRGVFELLSRGRRPPVGAPIDGRSIRNVLVLRYDAIGDWLVSTMCVRWLRMALPHAAIDVVSSTRNASIIAADPHVDWSYPIDPKHPDLHPSLLRLKRSIPRDSYDLVLALPGNRMTRAALISQLVAPSAAKVALIHHIRNDIYSRVFSHFIDHPLWLEHWGVTFLRMASEVVIPAVEPRGDLLRPYVVLDQASWERVERFLRENRLSFGGFGNGVIPGRGWTGEWPEPFAGDPFCVLNISAYIQQRCWAPERCAAVASMLVERYRDLQVFISGSPKDARSVRGIVERLDHPRVRTEPMRLTEFAAFAAAADFIVSPDTATVHMAAAAERPVMGLYAERIKACEWYPFGTRFVLAISSEWESINPIPPELVMEGIERLLE